MLFRLNLLSVCLVTVLVYPETTNGQTNETTTTTTASTTTTSANTSELLLQETKNPKNRTITVEMQPITQPIGETHSQTQQIGRTLLPGLTGNTSNSFHPTIRDGLDFRPTPSTPALISSGSPDFKPSPMVKPSDFRPSPQLSTYYEYNRFPVVPALPEAKTFGSGSGINLDSIKPTRTEYLPPWMLDKPSPAGFPPPTTQGPWYNKINFPTTQNPLLTVKDHPYPYLITGSYPETTTRIPEVHTSYLATGIHSEAPRNHPKSTPKFGIGQALGSGFSSKFGGGGLFGSGGKGGGGYEYSYPVSSTGHGQGHGEMSVSDAWKKVIKFLTAVIPIGLFLSALTPTIINVAPLNTTQPRGRAEGPFQNLEAEKLLSSLNYSGCEDRIICELLIGAGSSLNAEQHVENLLEAFTDKEKDAIRQYYELQKVLEAVKKSDCSSLVCKSIKKSEENVKNDLDDDKKG